MLNLLGKTNLDNIKSHDFLVLKRCHDFFKINSSLDKTVFSLKGELDMRKKEMVDGFDTSDIKKHKKKYIDEVIQKYDKKVSEEYERKTLSYDKNKWSSIMESFESLFKRLADNMDKDPNSKEVQEVIHAYRMHISDNFYDCNSQIFRGLGELYVSDFRFTKNIDRYAVGLSEFIREAITHYCDNIEE